MSVIPLYWFFKDDLVPEMYDLHIIRSSGEKNANSTTKIQEKNIRTQLEEWRNNSIEYIF